MTIHESHYGMHSGGISSTLPQFNMGPGLLILCTDVQGAEKGVKIVKKKEVP
jgi:hypothetical protein